LLNLWLPAIGIGIDVEEPMGNMVIDIGGGTTEIAVIALAGIVCDQSIRIAGDEFTNDISEYMRREHNILIGERSAERIKIEVAQLCLNSKIHRPIIALMDVTLMTGIPKQITVTYTEIAMRLIKSVTKIEEAILKALELTPPELSADIYQTGLYLTGGGALLRDLQTYIHENQAACLYCRRPVESGSQRHRYCA